MDLFYFVKMSRKEAEKYFQTGADSKPFKMERIKYKIDEKHQIVQEVLDYSSHLRALQKAKNQSKSRVAAIKA